MKDLYRAVAFADLALLPAMDLENRILKRVVFVTRRLAADGWIIEPEGLETADYQANGVVTAGHDNPETRALAPVIGRMLEVAGNPDEMYGPVQFADTALGREFAYLYGLNPKHEVFMRGWSVEGKILERSAMSFDQARRSLGGLWEARMADLVRAAGATNVRVATRFYVKSVAAVPVGADKGALSRAFSDGVRAAGDLLARMDLEEARREIAEQNAAIRVMDQKFQQRLFALDQQMQALVRDGAAAAAKGDSAELLTRIRELVQEAKRRV